MQGPGLVRGLLSLALAVAPAILIQDQPWKGIAVGNAIAHFVLGFAWTMVGTSRTEPIKQFGLLLWFLTIPFSLILLLASFVLNN